MIKAGDWETLARLALAEDMSEAGDVTSLAIVPGGAAAHAVLVARENGIVCGLEMAEAVFRLCDAKVAFSMSDLADGSPVAAGRTIAHVDGEARGLLAAERTALNFVQLMSGIATMTRRVVDEVSGTKVRVFDTRKTHPLLRGVEKYAVSSGGGCNHRQGLSDAVLIKDNHIALAGGVVPAVEAVRGKWGDAFVVEVEVDTIAQFKQALGTAAAIVLLDNMNVAEVAEAVGLNEGRKELEVSGGITLENVRAYAETGVDRVAIGALTMAAPPLDVAMDMLEQGGADAG